MKKKAKHTATPSAQYGEYPLIGYEYEYIGQPVMVIRSCPSVIGPRCGHVEFETRFGDRSSCDSGELGMWQDTTKTPTKKEATFVMLYIQEAIEDASSESEALLAKWQLRRLKKLMKQQNSSKS